MDDDKQVKNLAMFEQLYKLPANLQARLRIVQSVQNRQYQLGSVFGNVAMVLLIFTIGTEEIMSGPVKFLLAAKLLFTVPILRAHLRLRKRPRPQSVDQRHIRLVEVQAVIMAVIWAGVALLLMPVLGQADAIVLFWAMIFTCTAAVAMSASLPKVSISYSTIILVPTFFMAYAHHVLPGLPLTIIMVGIVVGLGYLALQGWRNTISEVQVSLQTLETEAKRSKVMENLSAQLGKFLSPQLVQSIIRGNELAVISSRRRKLTVFFSDIVGFSEITEQMESEELTTLLNSYLTEMSSIAMAHGGTIDKFIGDAIVVYFGDPESRGAKEDAEQCVRMALTMQRRARQLHKEWLDVGLERGFELRVGINTGYCTVGNFGSEQRMDYTIIGSPVNLAARLERAADAGSILLANETYSLVKDLVLGDEAAQINVKGFQRPVRTFRVHGLREKEEQSGGHMRHQNIGLTLELDPSKMDADELKSAEGVLEAALGRIRNSQL
ncbi:adenylate/guanylate cyclase domain-containing protein [Phaeobacter marinintestinus]|uniref:adenylate/guanylate cyclase domain-containing protein n=1 Tax=Falsiphaeobacter marinintestinus TaxID=1492905 RepID=UPI0011B6DC11|nr:adenylate/guanylate cyclase domain-containing protein [Phaeobacter marinintestinus]